MNTSTPSSEQKNEIKEKKNPFAIWGFIIGVVSVFLGMGLPPIAAIILSVIGINKTKEPKTGKWMAVTGLVLGILYFIVYLYNFGYLSFMETPRTTTAPITNTQIVEKINTPEITTQPAPTKTPASTATWKFVTSFEGVGMKKLPPFTIMGSKWRIKWSCNTTEGQFGLSVTGYSVKGGDTGSEIIHTTCPFSGTNQYEPSPGYGGAGAFYLDILADQYIENQPGWATSWKITVEELR
ncbi:MAG: DUF4190 domain-containing protein [Candidatus Liptonbacteria bacterium]|nr:DUF4190 domain-containing protein [Candidatus Liptonbacteria bacterium]